MRMRCKVQLTEIKKIGRRSEHIFHAYRLAAAAIYRKGRCRKFGRSERDFWIARKTETFARNSQRCIQLAIAIFVMNQGQGVGSWDDAIEHDRAGSIGLNHPFDCNGIF